MDVLARRVIGAAIEVHRELGPGFLESVYQRALAVEMAARGLAFTEQQNADVTYKGISVGRGKVDFFVGDRPVVELKAVDAFHPIHRAQVHSYLRALNTPLGLLLNFKSPLLRDGIERIVRS